MWRDTLLNQIFIWIQAAVVNHQMILTHFSTYVCFSSAIFITVAVRHNVAIYPAKIICLSLLAYNFSQSSVAICANGSHYETGSGYIHICLSG